MWAPHKKIYHQTRNEHSSIVLLHGCVYKNSNTLDDEMDVYTTQTEIILVLRNSDYVQTYVC
jgi:hypothetical protein